MEDIKDKHSQLFMLLIGTYEMAALQQMGKIKSPLTDKIESNLEQAQFTIELLDALKEKTKGNLNEYEQKYLDNVIAQLKLNYVDEAEKEKKQSETAETDTKNAQQEPPKDSPEGDKAV